MQRSVEIMLRLRTRTVFLVIGSLFIGLQSLQISSYAAQVIHISLPHTRFHPMPAHFWSNTGFCPPAPTNSSTALAAFFNGRAVRLQLDHLSALPTTAHNSRIAVRVHWLLNLIRAERRRGADDASSTIRYDFTALDAFVEHLMRSENLVPVWEWMGDPSGVFAGGASSQEPRDLEADWRDLVEQLLRRYIGE